MRLNPNEMEDLFTQILDVKTNRGPLLYPLWYVQRMSTHKEGSG